MGCGGEKGVSRDLEGVKSSAKDFAKLVRAHDYEAVCEKYYSARTQLLIRHFGGCKRSAEDEPISLPTNAQIDRMTGRVSGNHAASSIPGDNEIGTATYEEDHWVFGDEEPSTGSPTTIDIETPDRVVQQGVNAVAAFNAGKQLAPKQGA